MRNRERNGNPHLQEMQNAKLKTILRTRGLIPRVSFLTGFIILVFNAANVYAQNIKEPEFAGFFYPAEKEALEAVLDSFLEKPKGFPIKEQILGIISPHAGYTYSGSIAAYGFKSIQNKEFDTVIILGASHRYWFKGVSIYPQGIFNTPLGSLEIDRAAVREFSHLEFVQFQEQYFINEHSFEVQLPFIIKVLGNVKIVPVIFGEVDFEDLEKIGNQLSEIARQKRILVIVSTDLSHYHPYKEAVKIDKETIQFIKDKNTVSLWLSWSKKEARACGLFPLIAFLSYCKDQAADIKILKYANSQDTAGDKNKVVGYVSAAAFKKQNAKLKMKNEKIESEKEGRMAQGSSLTKDDKVTLLEIARSTLDSFLKNGKMPPIQVESDNLKVNRGAFVTLHKNGQLRGCIGRMAADTPLYKVVPEFAVYSATQDTRFSPVTYEELKDIELEISVLTEPVILEFKSTRELLDKLHPSKDGVIITTKYGSSTYLPQVWEQLPDKKEFLSNLCVKGGAPYDYWETNSKDVKVQTYQAIVFSESEFQ